MDLARTVEANMAEWVLTKASGLADVEVRRAKDVCWVFTPKPAPDSTVVLARFVDGDVSRRVSSILDRHLQNKLACTWITGPMSEPLALGDVLRKIGFHCMIHCAGMACDLREVADQAPQPQGVTVEPVNERPQFAPLTTERRRRAQAMADGLVTLHPRCAWHFAATLDNEVVGRTTLFLAAGVAGIYDVEVLKHARYRGVGTALVDAALRQAIGIGQQHAVLAATGAGFGVYQRLGFREVTKISFWRYGKMRQEK